MSTGLSNGSLNNNVLPDSNNSGNNNLNSFESKMISDAEENVNAARKVHKRALRSLGDAKKHQQQVQKQVELSKKLSKLVNRNDINIVHVRKAYNNAVKAGVPESYGSLFSKKQTPVGKAHEILASYNNMQSVRKSLKNPSMITKMSRSMARKVGLRTETNNRVNDHKRMEAAYELCEKHGICGPEMNQAFNEVASLENTRTHAKRQQNKKTQQLMASMPKHMLVKHHRLNMPQRQRHQPNRLTSKVFQKRGSKLRAHSIANENNAHKMFNNNIANRQSIGIRKGNLPQPKRRTKKVPTRRASN